MTCTLADFHGDFRWKGKVCRRWLKVTFGGIVGEWERTTIWGFSHSGVFPLTVAFSIYFCYYYFFSAFDIMYASFTPCGLCREYPRSERNYTYNTFIYVYIYAAITMGFFAIPCALIRIHAYIRTKAEMTAVAVVAAVEIQ